jgi:hypothetical protein
MIESLLSMKIGYSYLVHLPNPGKDHTKIQGHCIITMQKTVCKFMEQMIARKITNQLKWLRLLPPTLGKYRSNIEMWMYVATFAYDVYESIHAGVETCATAIDLE